MRSGIDQPVIVIGLGRSGSTLFHRMLAAEKSLDWFCQVLERRPGWYHANRRLMNLRALPGVGSVIEARLDPVEAYGFWDRCFPGFRSPCRDLTAGDVNERIIVRVRKSFQKCINAERARLLLKVTGWPRVGCLTALFPDATLIHVSRDPRAVINSLLQVSWWRGWQGPSNWRWGPLSESDNEVWMRHEQSFVALAAIQCRIYQRAYLNSISKIPKGTVCEVSYDSLCNDSMGQLAQVFEKSKLRWTPEFERRLAVMKVHNTDYKYREQLSTQQVGIIEAVLEEVGYEV